MTPFRDIESRRNRAKSSYTDPKKHYVRGHGWLPVFQKYAPMRKDGVKYLTLCAKLAIDIRYFRLKSLLPHDDQEKRYPTVAFIEQDAQDYAIIAESLGTTKLGIKGDLERILLEPATFPEDHKALIASFPYDIINLDFTGDVVPENDPPYNSTIRAIERIMQTQHDKGAGEWHMFLTFRACRSTANDDANGQLQRIIEGNMADEAAKAAYGGKPAPSALLANDYKEFLRIGLAKFLASSSGTRGYAFTLDGSYHYPRRPKGGGPNYYIITLVAGFRPIRATGHLNNPHEAQGAYKASVLQIFSSAAVDVYTSLGDKAELRRVIGDLAPVMQELKREKLVE
ncbi:MAG: hypothetical protein NTY77_14945 [Elusimicrobia bacterium]|nr:hypothetical protein [Elusimicrobiota bacterium]